MKTIESLQQILADGGCKNIEPCTRCGMFNNGCTLNDMRKQGTVEHFSQAELIKVKKRLTGELSHPES